MRRRNNLGESDFGIKLEGMMDTAFFLLLLFF
jgi:hypothetical protein